MKIRQEIKNTLFFLGICLWLIAIILIVLFLSTNI